MDGVEVEDPGRWRLGALPQKDHLPEKTHYIFFCVVSVCPAEGLGGSVFKNLLGMLL